MDKQELIERIVSMIAHNTSQANDVSSAVMTVIDGHNTLKNIDLDVDGLSYAIATAWIEDRERAAGHNSAQCPRCAWEMGKNILPISKPCPHDCVCTEYGPCLKHRDEMKEPGLFDALTKTKETN